MINVRDIRSFLTPTVPQAIISVAASLIYIGLAFNVALTALISGATNTQPTYFQQSYHQQVSTIGQLGFTKDLTIGIFWAGVGIIGYFVVITLINLIIGLRNEIVIDSMYASAGALVSRLKEPLVRLVLLLIFALALLLTLNQLIPNLWLPLFGNLILIGFSFTYLLQALAAIVGLALNAYVLGLIVLGIKNLNKIL